MNPDLIAVLIVDDDVTFGQFLEIALGRIADCASCHRKWVTSGAAALEEIERGIYTLILLDYRLQDTDGLALLTKIQRLPLERRPAVVMLTGGGSEEIAVEAMKRGAKDYLVKGAFEVSDLRRAIVGAIDRRLLEIQLARSTEELRQKNDQMEAELAMAREVQQALLPQQYPTFPGGAAPENSALRFCQRWIPSSTVAGDFFEVFAVSDTAAGVFLCDVMGHGVRAALVTTLIRGLLGELMHAAADPGRFLGELNRSLKTILARSDDVMFATAFYLVIEVESRELRFANAGHPPPLHLQRGAGRVTPLCGEAEPDSALGLLPDATFATAVRPIARGDALLLFTDGLFEAEGAAAEQYGLARLQRAVEARQTLPVAKLFDALLADVAQFRGAEAGAGFADDVCLVGVEYV
jgi:phosphoserine phosphatase RsbU/P